MGGSTSLASTSELFDCSCLIRALPLASQDEEQKRAEEERLQRLKKGDSFLKSSLLGLTSTQLHVALSEDTATVQWKQVTSNITNMLSNKLDYGEIDLTREVMVVKITGATGLVFIGLMNDHYMKPIFEINAENTHTRDIWVLTLNSLLDSWKLNPSLKPKANITAASNSNKNDYFKKREDEIKQKEKENQLKKQKYSTGGMKYTAIALASRS